MYETLKIVHILAIISWMAGMLYLPRLFVYHAAADKGSVQSETFKVMERRLLRAIMTPAMIVSWVAGLWLTYEIGAFRQGWFHGKLALVLALSAVHGMLAKQVRVFTNDANDRGGTYFRVINEVPTLLMVGIVILVVAKPF